MRKPNPNEIYRHFKGNLYRVVTLATHTETGEELVVYQALYGDYAVYARPLSMFMSPVDKEKYPHSGQTNRFELAEELIGQGSKSPVEKVQTGQETEQTNGAEAASSDAEPENSVTIDPLVLEFLDADTYEQRLNILAALHHRITDDMINTMAVAVDVEVEQGDIEERYAALRTCLLTLNKYECSRIR